MSSFGTKTTRTYRLLRELSEGIRNAECKQCYTPVRNEYRKAIAEICNKIMIECHGGENQMKSGENPIGG
jgi:hypothetical protein